MARRFFLAFFLLALTASQNSFAVSTEQVVLNQGFIGTQDHLIVSSTTPEYTSIILRQPQIQKLELTSGIETFDAYGIEGEPVKPEAGAPVVPQISRLYRIPNTGSATLVVRDASFITEDGINPYPYNEEDIGFGQERKNPSIYSRDAWYPEQIAVISEPMILRDFRVVEVVLYPVQINPATGQARVYENIEVDIVANDEPGINELLNPRRPSGSFAPVYRSLISNLDETALDEVTTTPGTYMFIAKSTDAEVSALVDSLAEWKMRKGMNVVIDRRTSWTSTQMITAIQTLYATSDPPLEFVCLVGDPNASFGVPISSGSYDHAFALGNSGDDLEDIGVGRLSGEDLPQMATIKAKILGYERNPWMEETEWYTKAFLYAGISHSVASNWTFMQWADQQLSMHTGVTNNILEHHDGPVSQTVIDNALENGVSMFFWRGGYISEMSTSAANCETGWQLPVCFTITCGTGDFDWGESVAESWLIAGTPTNPKGAVCGIGMVGGGTHPPQNYTLAGGFVYSIANLGMEYLGHTLNYAKVWLSLTWGAGSSSATDFSRWCNLMGDPGLSIWTDVPVVMDAAHPAVLNVGARGIEITVLEDGTTNPISDALVVLWKGSIESPETYVKALTDAYGHVVLPITINNAGDLRLTITKRNYKPYCVNIPCVENTRMVALSGYTIDDDNSGGTSGNNDGNVNPNETIDIALTLENYGTSGTATGVSVSAACSNPNIVITQGTATFADIAPGATANGSMPLRLSVSPTMKYGEIAEVVLTVITSSSTTISVIELTCDAGRIEYGNYSISGTPLAPGVTTNLLLTVYNDGSAALNGTVINLVSLSSFVSISGNGINYGNIGVGQSVSSVTPFSVTANVLTYPGHQAPILIIAATSGGYIDTSAFVLSVGNASSTDPAGPDGFGYYAYDNTDLDYELHPEYDYVNISSGLGTNLQISDVGEKTAITPVWSKSRALPFPFTYYGVSYDSITVCSNGWMAFGNQSWNDCFRNYPIPAIIAPPTMIAPYWDDLKTSEANQGVWVYADQANHRYIVQWKAGGGTGYSQANLDFEVILYDTSAYPTLDGNGKMLFQYNDVQMNLSTPDGSDATGCTVGIQDYRGTTGLNYVYRAAYASGAANVVDGSAILFTTDGRNISGSIDGTITDAATNEPMENVPVTIIGTGYSVTTDNTGYYRFDAVIIGSHGLRASFAGFNDTTEQDVLVEEDLTTTVDFQMLHPEIRLSADSLSVEFPPLQLTADFDIINDGNGPLDYSIAVEYAGYGTPLDPWATLEEINVTTETGNSQIMGCEFAGDYWFVSASGSGGDNVLYRYSLSGELQSTIVQPSTSSFGWYDMAWDGQYLYGGEDGVAALTGIDLNGNVQTTIASPLNPSRAIAYDPDTDHFWVADLTQDIYEIDRDGTIISVIANGDANELRIAGLAWYPNEPDGYKLFVFSQDGAAESLTKVTAIHPIAQLSRHVTTLVGVDGDRAAGCTITKEWNSTLYVFGGIHQHTNGDRFEIHYIDFDATWITVTPAQSSVEGFNTASVSLGFNLEGKRGETYRIALSIYNNVLDTTLSLPVIIEPVHAVDPDRPGSEIPAEYALHQNYPNPFNPSTTIEYDLKASGHATIMIYNLVGQEVERVVDDYQQAGRHAVQFEASALPSGVYFYQLRSGDFTATQKMVLMK